MARRGLLHRPADAGRVARLARPTDYACASVDSTVEIRRREWAEGHRRLEALSRDNGLYQRLHDELGLVLDELRRRIGESFTLAELAGAYDEADRWSREVLVERGSPGAYRHAALLEDAAFHLYARGASDYRP